MADEENVDIEETSEEEPGSVEDVEEQIQEPDLKLLLEQSEKERKELASLVGRQGQELGELRKAFEERQAEGQQESYDDYFDDDTKKVISKIVDSQVAERIAAERKADEERRLKEDFAKVYHDFEIDESSLGDLAFYAAQKNVSLHEAANQLSQKGIIEKRGNKGPGIKSSSVDVSNSPKGMPKIPGGKPGSGRNPVKMTQEEYNSLSDEEREAFQRKYYGPVY